MKAEEIQCPRVCYCSNKTVATCKDLEIDGIDTAREGWFETDIEQLDFSGNKLSSINPDTFGLWNVLNLHSFNLSGNNILNITKFTFSGFSNLENLDLSSNNISWIDCEAFEFTPHMAVVRLRSNRLTEICPHTFSPLEYLWYLDLSNNMISSIQPETLHQNSVLEWLSLATNRLTEIHPETLRVLRHLRHLDFSNNMISSIQPETLHQNSSLEWLSLANNRLNVIDPDTLRLLRHLRHMDLSNNMLSSTEPETFHNNSVLEWLSLANNRLSEIHLEIFRKQRTLSYLDLSGNRITKIEGAMFHRTRNLEILLLSSNNIFEYSASASNKENELFYIDLSRNTIERLGSLTFSRNCLQSLHSRNFSILEEKRNSSSNGNNTSEINVEAFVGLENLKYLDLSSNNVSKISLSVFHNILPQNEIVTSEDTCVSLIKGMNLSNNAKHSSNLGKDYPFNLTSIILCNVEILELKENCLSIFDDNPVNVLNTSGTLINLTNNTYTYECSLSQDINETMNVTSLNCLSQGKLKISEHNNYSTTVETSSENEVSQPLLHENVLIFGIYASSVFVAIIVVLVITHVVGKPEPDEFWWEDKLAKRNY
jgi:Leucine-rich repeat (LRR) protein